MKITFLGTSHGVPCANRFCQSMLIEFGESAYLVDAGAPVIDLLIRKNFDFKKLKAVFITHMHGDHIDGLLSLIDLSTWYFKETSYDVYLTEEEGISCFKNMIEMIFKNCAKFPEERIRFKLVDAGMVYKDENVEVTAVPTKHLAVWGGRPSYGYVIADKDKKIYISGDLDGNEIDYNEITEKEEIDAFIVECAHFMPDRLIEKLKKCVAKRVVLIHGYREEIKKYFDDFEKTNPSFELIYPNDGDELSL